MLRSLALIAVVACLAGAAASAHAQERGGTTLTPRQREDERKAISAFAAGRYQDALNLYADLYADFRDPIYLRNIGRCHAKLKRPDEAISSFQDYLARYKRITPTEREEVQGWIDEMKALQQPPAPAPSPVPVVQPATPPAPAPVVVAPPPPVAAPPPVSLIERAPPREEPDSNAGIRRIGIGALILGGALAAAGGTFMALSWSKKSASENGACGTMIECGMAADTIDQRSTLSKVFFIGAAAAGVAGGAMILFFPVSSPDQASMSGFGAAAAVTF